MSVSLAKAPVLHALHNDPEIRAGFKLSRSENRRIMRAKYRYDVSKNLDM